MRLDAVRHLAERLLARALGRERGAAVLGDLEEDLARVSALRARPLRLPGIWLLWQAVTHVLAVRWAERHSFAAPSRESGARRGFELATLWHDVRTAIRGLRQTPAFTAVALIVLTLGIGASTAIFSVVDAVVLKGLPYPDADRLVQVTTFNQRTGTFRGYETPQDFADWKAAPGIFEAVTAVAGVGFTLAENGRPEELPALRVTAGYFDVFRVRPQIGQPFTETHEIDGNHEVALISDALWRRRFGADPEIVGRRLISQTGTYGVIGVMPPDFQSTVGASRPTDVWVPYVVPDNQKQRGTSRNRYLRVTGRLAEDVSIEQADTEIKAITAGLAERFPRWFPDQVGAVRSLHEATVGRARSWMLMLLGAVGVVLLSACANVANLMLARATSRARELRIRAALGAGRWRIARGLLIESLVLSSAGTLLGLLMALWLVDVLRVTLPQDLPRIATVALDLRVLAAAAAAAVVTGLLFGLAPALQASRQDVSVALREGARGAVGGRQRLRSGLVVAEVALATVLLVGAGLFVSSFVRLTSIDIGLDPRHVLTMSIWPRVDVSDPDWVEKAERRVATAVPEILGRLNARPGILSAGFISGGLPLSGDWSQTDVSVPGRPESFRDADAVDLREVTPGYAQAIGARVIRGRHIMGTDIMGAPEVVVLNEEAVQRYLSGVDPLGARVVINDVPRTVVGVVANVRLFGPEGDVRPEAYVPVAQTGAVGGSLVIRTAGEPLAFAGEVREMIWASLPDTPAGQAETMASLLQGYLARRQFNMLLVGIFGALALAISAVGIYGVMAYAVVQRTPEIGVRMALGARPGGVLSMVLRSATALVAAGLLIGLSAAWYLSALVEAFLFQVPSRDLVVYGASALVIACAGLMAAFVPARRAASVDPITALRAG